MVVIGLMGHSFPIKVTSSVVTELVKIKIPNVKNIVRTR